MGSNRWHRAREAARGASAQGGPTNENGLSQNGYGNINTNINNTINNINNTNNINDNINNMNINNINKNNNININMNINICVGIASPRFPLHYLTKCASEYWATNLRIMRAPLQYK